MNQQEIRQILKHVVSENREIAFTSLLDSDKITKQDRSKLRRAEALLIKALNEGFSVLDDKEKSLINWLKNRINNVR
jgi:hypothetical protein